MNTFELKSKNVFFTFVMRFLRAPEKEAVFDSDCLLTTWKSAQNKAQIIIQNDDYYTVKIYKMKKII